MLHLSPARAAAVAVAAAAPASATFTNTASASSRVQSRRNSIAASAGVAPVAASSFSVYSSASQQYQRNRSLSLLALSASRRAQELPRHYAIIANAAASTSSTSSSSYSSSSSTGIPSASSATSSSSKRSLNQDEDDDSAGSRPRRSLLYVPGSSEKMIKGSQKTDADCIIFDLEDSVAPHRKGAARETVLHGLNAAPRPGPELAVRINPPSGDIALASDDLDIVLPSHALQALVLPKVESAEDVFLVLDKASLLRPEGSPPIALILSVESAASLHNMPTIISEVQQRIAELTHADPSNPAPPPAYLSALLFASEDFCAATSIIRTRSRHSLLVPRAQVVLTARAFGLSAIDMVCVDIKDEACLTEEAQEAKELGFDAKQVVHPSQVGPVQRIFAPSEAEVRRAARITFFYQKGIAAHLGAVSLPDEDDPNGSATMIDAPMLKQADAVLAKARAARMAVPDIAAEEEERKKQGNGGGANGKVGDAVSAVSGGNAKGKEGGLPLSKR
ncbi:unnamed protein product [Tilletia controversa]|uniref:HpcH/HpaI aldolase/citrate lyase domain-containing protein n=3 Tax=Tilletia TaxID=13289 RepID=A0A8X7MXW2_9BASI|nr:hypothetical protein CF336_g1883 [Tilletia laevis]KAE8203085.1 hypothetical protein CF328_g1843 [Tilletia controversa]KAE8263826.1 hypothetical protein A4X03_0g1391 [Tilletia caries]KAE8206469.1 hypothetical protein CF335_g1862 [Tilletia laevis]KAE8252234.1 hypothetical protein A4X06_0g2338 [Tilletia controversa]